MASTVTSTNNLSLRSILEKDKLTGSNFLDWERNLMIVLRHERKWYVLEEPLGEAPPANAPAAARNAHKKHSDDLLDVACLMLATMSPDLQAGLINTNAYDMIRQLRDMFQTQARTERYDATKAFNECKMVKGTSVSDHVMKMKRHLDHLERLGHPVPLQLATDTILNSLSEDYRPFVVNYNMNNMEKTIAELHSMLKTAELNMGNKNKTKDVLMVKDGGVKKKNGHASTSKGKGPVQAIQSAPKKGKGKGKGKKVKPNKARTENRCFICNEIGHWRQNCPKRHEAGGLSSSNPVDCKKADFSGVTTKPASEILDAAGDRVVFTLPPLSPFHAGRVRALGSLITFINPELGFFKSESDFLIFRVGKSVFRIGKPVFPRSFPHPFFAPVFRIGKDCFPHPFSELENPFSESGNPFSAPVFRIGKDRFPHPFSELENPFSESENSFSTPVFHIRFPHPFSSPVFHIRFPHPFSSPVFHIRFPHPFSTSVFHIRFPHPVFHIRFPHPKKKNPKLGFFLVSLFPSRFQVGNLLIPSRDNAFPSRNSARVEIPLSSFTYSLIMTPNLSHFQPQSTTSNGSVSLDPSQKGVLMQLLRQNQHLMQLLVRRQLMQQPMSWTMEMHYPRSSTSDHFWIFDSGCFNHMSPYPAGFITKQPSPHPTVRTADLTPKHVLFSGNYSTDLIQLPEVLHVPGLAIGLVSLTQLQEMGLLISFDFFGCAIQDPKTKQILGKGRRVGRTLEVIYLRLPLSSSHTNLAAPISTTSSFDLWHARLGHLSSARIKLLANSGVLGNVTSNEVSCLSCKLGKHHALPFELNDYTSVSAFDLIHSDVWGPAPHPSMGGHRFFELITLWNTKNLLSSPFFDLKALSHSTLVRVPLPKMVALNANIDISLILSALSLSPAKCPERFWGEAAFTAVYTINRHPTPVLQHKLPYEVLHGVLPTYELLKVWGCACFVQLQPHEYTKLEPRGRLCLFLGYGIEHKGYRCWDPISKRLRISRHVTFWEDVPFYDMPNSEPSITHHTPFFTDPSLSLDTPFTTPIPTPVSDSTATTSDPSPPVPTPSTPPESPAESTDPGPSTSTAVRRSDRVRQVPAHLRDYHCYATLLSHHEPTSYKEASSSSHWQAAMQEELRALAKAQTWDSVPLPPGKRPIGSKWVFKIKTKSDGSIDRYKARLVAKGFNQEYGIDYEETFAPVARVTSVRSLLAIAATKNWPLFQMDVKNAFLNGDLSEEVYMTPPPGVSLPSGHVCRLRKALYGLKQAPRAWFEKFSNTVLSLGFYASNYDSGLFTRTTAAGSILLLLYVDDMIITGSDSTGIASLKQSLSSAFEMKDLGKLHYFLGLEVLSDVSGTYLCQAKYISDLLSKAGLSDTKVASTPLEYNLHLTPSAGTPLQDPTRYRQLVGSLVYLTVTRPDIAYAVHTVSQFMAAPRSDHYAAVLRILRYLKGTMFHGLYFSSTSSLVLRGFSDADWDSDMTDRRSTTGYCFFLGDSLISWRSKKQSLTARSSTEAEYRALADTSQELIWLRWLLSDMGAPQKSPTPLWCDNNSAIQIAHNDVFHERTKHIEIDCHFVRQHVVRNTIRLHPISTLDQPADIFTKAHLPGRFRELVTKLNLSHSSPD
ncbi:hypothetical protein OSB04_030226 [Centaurea solstitialis]|uniref:CCHC-type domain-containing protein n=1 Tax=Centaurea solstitialis TaxID=347529 RepID=A0AA38S813_9ASTR|nr:hypothetical protein OSB04_030226 [Centaurea solstitialis]